MFEILEPRFYLFLKLKKINFCFLIIADSKSIAKLKAFNQNDIKKKTFYGTESDRESVFIRTVRTNRREMSIGKKPKDSLPTLR